MLLSWGPQRRPDQSRLHIFLAVLELSVPFDAAFEVLLSIQLLGGSGADQQDRGLIKSEEFLHTNISACGPGPLLSAANYLQVIRRARHTLALRGVKYALHRRSRALNNHKS